MKYLIWANFKMNKTPSELKKYLEVFKEKYSCYLNIDLMIAPDISELSLASDMLEKSCINLWSQNMYYKDSWAYTWEISPTMLNELKCSYVILGHSERRTYFNENDELINKKILSAVSNKIRPILCIWENLEQKERLLTKEVLKMQIINWLWWVENFEDIDIAYEPVWSIWTWKIANTEYIEEIHNFIREIIWNNKSRIIYGWSVKPENSKKIIWLNNVNWFLVWTASLDPFDFLKIAEI